MNSYDWHEAGLTVGQVAERSGAAPSALRFYERQGLISTDRTAGNQRRYRGDVLCRVAMIRVCQQAGLTLTQIRVALAEAVPDGVNGHWRAEFDFTPAGDAVVDMRLFLRLGERTLSETWLYQLQPA